MGRYRVSGEAYRLERLEEPSAKVRAKAPLPTYRGNHPPEVPALVLPLDGRSTRAMQLAQLAQGRGRTQPVQEGAHGLLHSNRRELCCAVSLACLPRTRPRLQPRRRSLLLRLPRTPLREVRAEPSLHLTRLHRPIALIDLRSGGACGVQ